jgi:hypothetical protein
MGVVIGICVKHPGVENESKPLTSRYVQDRKAKGLVHVIDVIQARGCRRAQRQKAFLQQGAGGWLLSVVCRGLPAPKNARPGPWVWVVSTTNK